MIAYTICVDVRIACAITIVARFRIITITLFGSSLLEVAGTFILTANLFPLITNPVIIDVKQS